MKFLHVILPSKRMMNTYVKMIRDNFDSDDHAFLFLNRCVGREDRSLFEYGNMLELPKTKNKVKQVFALYKILKSYDYIIWHGLIFDWKKSLAIFLMKSQLKKSVWVIRGIDLYNYKIHRNGIKAKFINWINYRIRQMIPKVAIIFPTDEEIYIKEFGNGARCFHVEYPMGLESFDEMDRMAYGRPRENGEVWILNGNNAYTFNRHIEVLKKLLKFKEEPIKIIIPLSYGNTWYNSVKNYKREILNFLKENYAGKYHVLFKLIPIAQYNELLANIDVAIINSNRQNALGNILRLLYMGSKVYLAKDNPVYDYLRKQGIPIYAVENIEKEDFNEFKENENSYESAKWVKAHFHPDTSVIDWKYLFDEVSHSENGIYSIKEMEQKARWVMEKIPGERSSYQKRDII